jgi:cellulose synthase/poly-beta-1,6-N-acetylglucosamine synthase-like glycosyltransferase
MPRWETLLWLACYATLCLGLSAFGAHKLKVLFGYWRYRHRPPAPQGAFSELPHVTVQLPLFNEAEVLDTLVKHIRVLDYPKDRLQIQFLDDSTDETTALVETHAEELRKQGFDVEVRHRTNRQGFKAGALHEAMATVKGEFIAIFDADFTPEPDFLLRCIPHFTDPRVGIVQARWIHRNRDFSLLTRLQAILLDGHLMLEQTSRSRWGEFCNFNGTAGLWRRATIEDAGGWRADTLTEDLDLTYRAQFRGWKFVYLNDVLVPAELPPDMDAYKSQQHRWVKGSIQVCLKMLGQVWRSPLPLHTKLEATAHLGANFANLLTLVSLVLVYPWDFLPQNSWQKAVFLDLPLFFFATITVIAFYLTAQGAQRPYGWLKALPLIPLYMALGIGMTVNNTRAVLEALLGHQSEFVRTPKYGVNHKAEVAVKARPFRYKAGKSIALWGEVILAGYFGWLLWLAVQSGDWGTVPYRALFAFGFAYVAAGSLFRRFSMASVGR